MERQEPELQGMTWKDVAEYAVRVRDWGEAQARDLARIKAIVKPAAPP